MTAQPNERNSGDIGIEMGAGTQPGPAGSGELKNIGTLAIHGSDGTVNESGTAVTSPKFSMPSGLDLGSTTIFPY